MVRKKTLVILGGTAEARQLANRLVEGFSDKLNVITSLAGRTETPRLPKGDIRLGGFGGAEGLATYLEEVGADLLIDATHPYAAQISKHAATAADQTGIPRMMFVRIPWTENDDDQWIDVANVDAVAKTIPSDCSACLITTGINDLSAFTSLPARKVFVRLIEQPKDTLPIEDAEVIFGRPPYKTDEEIALFRMLGIDCVVSKNAGGPGTYAKIEAARTLGIPVVMVARPTLPDGADFPDIDSTISAVREKLSLD